MGPACYQEAPCGEWGKKLTRALIGGEGVLRLRHRELAWLLVYALKYRIGFHSGFQGYRAAYAAAQSSMVRLFALAQSLISSKYFSFGSE